MSLWGQLAQIVYKSYEMWISKIEYTDIEFKFNLFQKHGYLL